MGLPTQAALVLLVLLFEFSEFPEGEGEGLELEDGDEDEIEDGLVVGVELGGATLFWIEGSEVGVVTGVG
jgi:hypothetical protein